MARKSQWQKGVEIYKDELKELLKTEKAKTTHVEITLQIEDDNIIIAVKDQGLGFKPKQEAKKINNDGFARESGRGIMMIKSYFDEVKFNKNNKERVIFYND